MDISHFDFNETDVLGLVGRLAGLANTITLEPRLHDDRAPTFRVSCLLRGGDGVFGAVAALEREIGVRVVLDRDNVVRIARADGV